MDAGYGVGFTPGSTNPNPLIEAGYDDFEGVMDIPALGPMMASPPPQGSQSPQPSTWIVPSPHGMPSHFSPSRVTSAIGGSPPLGTPMATPNATRLPSLPVGGGYTVGVPSVMPAGMIRVGDQTSLLASYDPVPQMPVGGSPRPHNSAVPPSPRDQQQQPAPALTAVQRGVNSFDNKGPLPDYDNWVSHRGPEGTWESPPKPPPKQASYKIRGGDARDVIEREEKPTLEQISSREQREAELQARREREEEIRKLREAKLAMKAGIAKKTTQEIASEVGLDKVAYPDIPQTTWSLPTSPPLPEINLEDELGKSWVMIEEQRAGVGGVMTMSRVMRQLHPSSAGREALA